MLAYPAWMAWLLFAEVTLAAGLAGARGAARTGERLSLGETARGAGAVLATTIFVALGLHAAGLWIGDGSGLIAVRHLMAQPGALLAGMGLLACGLALALWSAAFRGVGRFRIAAAAVALGLLAGVPHGFDTFALAVGLVAALLSVLTFGRPLRRWNGWLGGLLVGLVLNLILLLLGPPLSMVVAWPLVLASLLALVIALVGRGRFERSAAVLAALGIGVLAFGQIGHLGDQVFTAVGVGTPGVLAIVVLLLGWSFYPLLEGWSDWRRGPVAAAAIAAAGALILAFVALHDPATTRTPRTVQAFYLADPQTGQAWRASTLAKLDPWSAAALGQGVRRADLEPAVGEVWLASTSGAALAATTLALSHDGASGRRLLKLRPQNGGRDLKIYLRSNGPVGDILAEGRPTGLSLASSRWSLLHWATPGPSGVTLSLPPGSQTIEIRTIETIDGWPKGVLVPPKPPTTMPWPPSDSTLVMARYRAIW